MFSFHGSKALGALASSSPLTLLDVGARSGFHPNLEPLAPAIDAVGFEPDPDECARLNESASKSPLPWKSQHFIPVALGKEDGMRTLHLCHQPGCSSLLEPNLALVSQYQRDIDFRVERTLEVETTSLDKAVKSHGLESNAFLKIDIQGAELEVLQSSSHFLDTMALGILSEVEFMPLYKEQPLFSDLDLHLRQHGFTLIDFTFIRRWRSFRNAEHGEPGPHPVSNSRGRLAHADAFYLKDPEPMLKDPEKHYDKIIWIALLAANYGFLDYAYHLLQRDELKQLGKEELNFDASHEFQVMQRSAWRFIRERSRKRGLLENIKRAFQHR